MRHRYPLLAALAVLLVAAAVIVGPSLGPTSTVATVAASPAPAAAPIAAPASPGPTPASTVPGLDPYVGVWRVHGAEMTIKPDGTATEVIQLGPCRGVTAAVTCTATATLRVDASPGTPHLLYTGFRYTDQNGAAVVPDSLDGLPKVGDGYRLRVFAPGIIELIPLTQHLRDIMGTPYRCAPDADEQTRRRLCNA